MPVTIPVSTLVHLIEKTEGDQALTNVAEVLNTADFDTVEEIDIVDKTWTGRMSRGRCNSPQWKNGFGVPAALAAKKAAIVEKAMVATFSISVDSIPFWGKYTRDDLHRWLSHHKITRVLHLIEREPGTLRALSGYRSIYLRAINMYLREHRLVLGMTIPPGVMTRLADID